MFYEVATVRAFKTRNPGAKSVVLEVPEEAGERILPLVCLFCAPRARKGAFFGHFRAKNAQKRDFRDFRPLGNWFGGHSAANKIFIAKQTVVAALGFFS